MSTDVPIYLDYAATTPVEPAVAEAMAKTLMEGGSFGNPSSNHPLGRDALDLVETARAQLAALIGATPREIIWTSGATESDNMAITGAARYRAHQGKHLCHTTQRVWRRRAATSTRRCAESRHRNSRS